MKSMICKKSFYKWDDLTLVYAEVDRVVSFFVVPTSLAGKVTDDKLMMEYIRKNGFTHVHNDPMVQIAFLGDIGEKEFSAGVCMNNASSCYEFHLKDQKEQRGDGYRELISVFENGKGQIYEQHIHKKDNVNALECFSVFRNEGESVTVEMIPSITLNCISPFCQDNDADNLLIHRLRTNWSTEGKLETRKASELQLEDSWSSYGFRVSRIGQIGSMPCRTYMPFTALEDRNAGCTWAVALEAPMSWHLDVLHHQASISISGGIADFESGQFRKRIRRGESFRTWSAYVTAVAGGLEEACSCLQDEYAEKLHVPEIEDTLPVIYNEYCYSWGEPSMEKLRPMIDTCAVLGVKYFVVDVGWWRPDERSWYTFGDWNPSSVLFPDGLKELTEYIHAKGMIPGLWFEFESVSADSELYAAHPDFLLKRDNATILHRERAFLDFRKEEVHALMQKKVIELLRDNGFGYVKIDYNEPIGIGCDGAESYGEGLRLQVESVRSFFREIAEKIPGIVMEICSSGGHRLEPGFLQLGSMASFSDAHLGLEGAMIAADLHRWMLPKQMQIWAVLLREYSVARTYYTIVKGMLGRYCLSGELNILTEKQRSAVEESLKFYNAIRCVIKQGDTLIHFTEGLTSLRHPEGMRWLIRFSKDKKQAVGWLFALGRGNIAEIRDTRLYGYEVVRSFVCGNVEKTDECLKVIQDSDDNTILSAAILLQREENDET